MVAEGLSGEFCWAALICDQGAAARIDSGPAPASPTEEELTAAWMWEAHTDGGM